MRFLFWIFLLPNFAYAIDVGEHLRGLYEGATGAAEQFVKLDVPRLVVTTWEDDLRRGNQILYSQSEEGRFTPFLMQKLHLPATTACENLLEAAQYFALNKFRDTGYVSDDLLNFLVRIGDRLDAKQFRFFELIGVTNDPEARYDLRPSAGQVSIGAAPFMREKMGRTTGTLWNVAAQMTDLHVRKEFRRMPWQLDEAYASVRIDRERIRTAWEVGRVAQDENGGHALLSAASALAMVREVLIRDESLDDAFVFAHSLGSTQTRLFKRAGLFKTFAAHIPGEDEVLYAPLKDFLRSISLESVSQIVHEIRTAADGHVDALAALEIMLAGERVTRQEVDLVVPRFGAMAQPIVLLNATPEREVFINETSIARGVQRYAGQINPVIGNRVLFADSIHSLAGEDDPSIAALVPETLFGIGNLDPAIAAREPDYVLLLLLATYAHYVEDIESKAAPFVRDYLFRNLRFTLMSTDAAVTRQAYALAGVEQVVVSWNNVRFQMRGDAQGALRLHPAVKSHFTTVPVFSVDALRRLLAANPTLAREARRAFRLGNAQTLALLRGTF